MAVSVLVALSSAVACGGSPGKAAGTSAAEAQGRDLSGSNTPDKPWSEADLNRVALSVKDLDAYDVNRAVVGVGASRRTADPAMCGPIAQTLGQSSSSYAATARVGRLFLSKGDESGADMTLASHNAEDAR